MLPICTRLLLLSILCILVQELAAVYDRVLPWDLLDFHLTLLLLQKLLLLLVLEEKELLLSLLSLLLILLSHYLHTVSLLSRVLSHAFIDLNRTIMIGSILLVANERRLTRSLLTHHSIAQAFLVTWVVWYLILFLHCQVCRMVLIGSIVRWNIGSRLGHTLRTVNKAWMTMWNLVAHWIIPRFMLVHE